MEALTIAQISATLWNLLYLFIGIILAIFISKSNSSKFVKGVFIFAFVCTSIYLIMQTLAFFVNIKSIQTIFYYGEDNKYTVLYFIPVF